MADLAQFGIRVPPVEGREEAKQALRDIGKEGAEAGRKTEAGMKAAGAAVKKTAQDVSGSAGGFSTLTNAITKNAGGAGMLLRLLGPLGGSAGELADRLERTALAAEHMAGATLNSASRAQILQKAYESGQISAATMAAAQERLSVARDAAVRAEDAYAAALARTAVAQQEARALAAAITEQRAVVRDTSGERRIQEERVLNELQREQITVNSALRASIAETRASKESLSVANKQLADSERLVNSAQKASATGMSGTLAIIGGTIAALIGLAVIIETVRKAWDFLRDSVKEAGKEQREALAFKNVIGEGGAEQFEQLKSFFQSSGVFKIDDLLNAATQMRLLGAATQNTVRYTKDLATGAAAINSTVSSMAGAFETLILGRVMRPTKEMSLILQQMARDMKMSSADIVAWVRQASPDARIKAVTTAIENMGKEGGVAFNAIARAQATYEGKVDTLKTKWEVIKVAFGEPIIDALGPILDKWIGKLADGTTWAGKFGHAVAEAITWIGKQLGAEDHSGDRLGMKAVEGVKGADWKGAGENAEVTFADSFLGKWYADVNSRLSWTNLGKFFSGGLDPSAFARPPAPLVNPPPKETFAPEPVEQYRGAVDGASKANDNFFKGLERGHSTTEEFKGDLAAYNDYWYQYSLIQRYAQSATENTRRVQELQVKTLSEMRDPTRFRDIGSEWQRMEAEKVLAEKQADEAIKNGSATTLESMRQGIRKLADEWGNWSQTAFKLTQDIGKALASDISSGLTDIITGTKSVSEGFRDMAVSILRDISRIIIEMLVMKALFGSSTGGAGGATGGIIGAISQAFVHHGGGIVGGGAPTRNVSSALFWNAPRLHSGLMANEFPAILQRGEQVIPVGGSSGGNVTNIVVNVDNSGKTSSDVSGSGSHADARDLARMLEATMDGYVRKNRKHRGTLR